MGIKVKATGKAERKPDKILVNLNLFFKEGTYKKVLVTGTDRTREFKNMLIEFELDETQKVTSEMISSNGPTIREEFKTVNTNKKDKYGNFLTERVSDGFSYFQRLTISLKYNLTFLENLLNAFLDFNKFVSIDIQFGLEDEESLRDEALADAVSKCKRKAEMLAKALGCELDEIEEICYGIPDNNFRHVYKCCDYEATANCVENKISLAEILNPEPIKVTETVECVWDLEEIEDEEEEND